MPRYFQFRWNRYSLSILRDIVIFTTILVLGLIFYGDYILYKIPGNLTLTLYSYTFFGMIVVSIIIYLIRQTTFEEENYSRAFTLLKIGLGTLWLIDGILQLQPEMPYVFLPYVIIPMMTSTSGSLYNIILFGVNIWSLHPVIFNAMAAVTQLFIGIGLLIKLNKKGNVLILIVSSAWSLILWIFGEGFGGIFQAGSSFLSGLPGSALVYLIISIYLLLVIAGYEIKWIIPVFMAALFSISFILQAIPASQFWSGYSLSRIPYNLIFLYQPRFLSDSFLYFTNTFITYDFYWNLFFSVYFAVCAFAWLYRPFFAALLTIPITLFSWWVGQDFGIVSGYGTDPNSGLPLLIICVFILIYTLPSRNYFPLHVLKEQLSSKIQ